MEGITLYSFCDGNDIDEPGFQILSNLPKLVQRRSQNGFEFDGLCQQGLAEGDIQCVSFVPARRKQSCKRY